MESVEMRRKFDEAISFMLQNNPKDQFLFTPERYRKTVQEVHRSTEIIKRSKNNKPTSYDRFLQNHVVLEIEGEEKLFQPVFTGTKNNRKILYYLFYITTSELFDAIHSIHLELDHGEKTVMYKKLRMRYCNITKDIIIMYLLLCEHCHKKLGPTLQQTLLLRKLYSSVFPRAYLGFIDMSSRNYNDYRFVMVHEDCWTKFIVLKPLKSKWTKEIAINLLDIYTTFGPPSTLHANSDNDEKFIGVILQELHAMWNTVRVDKGKSSQNRTTTERIEAKLFAWLSKNENEDWLLAIKFIQYQENTTLHSGIRKTPYEAVFGYPARVSTTGLPLNEIPDEANNTNNAYNLQTVDEDEDRKDGIISDTNDGNTFSITNSLALRQSCSPANDISHNEASNKNDANGLQTVNENEDRRVGIISDENSDDRIPNKNSSAAQQSQGSSENDIDIPHDEATSGLQTLNENEDRSDGIIPDKNGDDIIPNETSSTTHQSPPDNDEFTMKVDTNIVLLNGKGDKIHVSHKRSGEYLEQRTRKVFKLSSDKFLTVELGATIHLPLSDIESAESTTTNKLS